MLQDNRVMGEPPVLIYNTRLQDTHSQAYPNIDARKGFTFHFLPLF